MESVVDNSALRLSLLWQMAPIVSWIFLRSAEASTPTSGTEPARKFTLERVKQQQKLGPRLCCSLMGGSYAGAVCVRVPSSLQAAVELSGASVDLSPEVVLQRAQRNAARGQTTVTGEPIVPPCSPPPRPWPQRVDTHRTLRPHTRAHWCFLQAT